MGSESTGGR